MKRLPRITALLLMSASTAALAAPDSCERVKSDIQQKIINNGVPESGFTLNIVPNDQADQPDAKWATVPTTPLKFCTPVRAAGRRPAIRIMHRLNLSKSPSIPFDLTRINI